MSVRIKRYINSIRGLGTVPGLISLALWLTSLCTLWLDHRYPEFSNNKAFQIFYTDYDTAKSVLSTVAAASITTLGLVYSIVLVVFTTAAGNIGPRLLQRFTADRANQLTAGLFGGTYLFSLTVLHQTDQNFVPAFSIACTFLLAGLSVLQLIYFVHTASISVTVDEEVAEIAEQLETDIAKVVHLEDMDDYEDDVPKRKKSGTVVRVDRAGYVSHLDVDALIKIATDNDTFLTLLHRQGDFVIPGQELAQFNSTIGEQNLDEVCGAVSDAISIARSRSPNSDIEFSVNLLIEIALRALSPGVNDTYTAVACIDRISSALVKPVTDGLRDHIRADDDKIPRLDLDGLTLDNLINTAFHPLRRASIGNVLMTKHILSALRRLHEIGSEDARRSLKEHSDLVLAASKGAHLVEQDVSYIHDLHSDFT